ncbi:glutamate receptor-interacting protein 1-like isoform X2 [Mercenaria mercenaria]|uniref:glutamate receptor-interacting protein 1-like isoform X2 n=1 Tax=Mercenaria mercenaria TaxID=6596 RepID=UPI00234EEF89|nr:glutamate receptor-interacting protein 1-like isoform X2 [Mercenaria mercenaria]
MPHWRPGCLRGSVYETDTIQYRPATNGYQGPANEDSFRDETRGTTLVDLHKIEGSGLGLILAGGVDKHVRAHISNLRPGGVAHRSDLLQVGDVLLSVNGIKTTNMKHDEIINLLKNADESVRLEVEYELPELVPADAFSVCCKQHTITLCPDNASFGFTLRGGMCQNRLKSRPLTVTQIRPGGPADREGSMRAGDRILAVNDFSIVTLTLTEMNMLLTQCNEETTVTVEYDVSVIDAVQKASGPLLIEIDKTPGAALGITLSHGRHKGKHCVCIDSIRSMSMADRCGALHVGDLILSIDGATVEHMTVAEAMQLLKSSHGDQIKMEILPSRLVDQKMSTDTIFLNAASIGSTSTSVFTASNQICRMDIHEVVLYGERAGLGLVLEANVPPNCILQDPPVVMRLEPHTAAERCGVILEGDRLLTVNGVDVCEKTFDEVNLMLQESWQHVKLEVEFDIADAVMASSGTFVVKLPRKPGGIGITLSAKSKLGNPLLITEVKKGSVAYRCGSVQPGDKLLSINDIRTNNLSMDEAVSLLKAEEEIIKLKLKREDHCIDVNGEELISYTVELERHGGPLGVTISGTDDPADPIVISALAEGGLAAKTGAIQTGDRLLAINSVPTVGKTLEEAKNMLHSAGDLVTLKIARKDKPKTEINQSNNSSKTNALREESCKSTTPVFSVDSALDSWDSSGQDINALSHQGQCNAVLKPRPDSASVPKSRENRHRRSRPYSSDSTDTGDDFGKKLSELQISDEALEGDHESSRSDDSSPGGADDWSKAFKNFKAQAEVIEQIPSPDKQHSTGSLDRRSLRNNSAKKERQKVRRNWSHSTSRGAISQNDLMPYVVDRRQRRCASSASARDLDNMPLKDQLKTVFSPQPIQLHRVTLVKESPTDDFGFGVSDGVYDKGVYISAIRPGSVAESMGLKQFDRILQINKVRTRDFDCSLAIPLIADAGESLDIVVCRNPLTQNKTALKEPQRRKPPPEPLVDSKSSDQDFQSADSIPVYMNVYNLDTPIARSEKSSKTV